jgi:hypothetical protein
MALPRVWRAGLNDKIRFSSAMLRNGRFDEFVTTSNEAVTNVWSVIRGVSQQLLLRELLPHKYIARCAERYKVKGCLAKVDAN